MSEKKCKHCGATIRQWIERWVAVADNSELCPSGNQVQFATRHEPRPSESTNAKLLDLLERHHKAWIAEDILLEDGEGYSGSELCKHTEAAIKRTTDPVAFTHERYGKTLRDLAANDQLRTRVPVWRCPACKAKFYTRAEYDDHRAEESALKEAPRG